MSAVLGSGNAGDCSAAAGWPRVDVKSSPLFATCPCPSTIWDRDHFRQIWKGIGVRWIGLLLLCVLLSACNTRQPTAGETVSASTNTPTAETPRATVTRGATQTQTSAPSATPQPSETPTPFVFAQVAAEPARPCPDAPPTRMILHERGRVLDDDPRELRMRSSPGVNNSIVMTLPLKAVFLVLDGPRCADTYTWFYVRYRNSEGWIAEGEEEFYYIEPYLPG